MSIDYGTRSNVGFEARDVCIHTPLSSVHKSNKQILESVWLIYKVIALLYCLSTLLDWLHSHFPTRHGKRLFRGNAGTSFWESEMLSKVEGLKAISKWE